MARGGLSDGGAGVGPNGGAGVGPGVGPNGGAGAAPVAFPSLAWFERLSALMRDQRALHEKLGYIDCTVRFVVLDGGPGGSPWGVQVRFEEFGAPEVSELGGGDGAEAPDFSVAATLTTWRGMIESIAEGGGRPALNQTLNDLNLRDGALALEADDSLMRHLFFRYNQSLQAFFNASGSFRTAFPRGDLAWRSGWAISTSTRRASAAARASRPARAR